MLAFGFHLNGRMKHTPHPAAHGPGSLPHPQVWLGNVMNAVRHTFDKRSSNPFRVVGWTVIYCSGHKFSPAFGGRPDNWDRPRAAEKIHCTGEELYPSSSSLSSSYSSPASECTIETFLFNEMTLAADLHKRPQLW